MAATKYTYSISGDFPNAKVCPDRLRDEIRASAIVTALQSILTSGDDCDIWFKDALSAGDVTILDGIVAAHSGAALPSTITKVKIEEEDIATGGHYQAQSFEIDLAAAAGITNKDITFPMPISLLGASIADTAASAGDSLEVHVAPDTIVGAITSGVEIDDTVINVSPTVTANFAVGFWVKIDTEDLGRVIAIDAEAGTITVENAATATHTAGDYVKMTVKMCPHLDLAGINAILVTGATTIGGSYISTGTVIRIAYNNVDGQAKNFKFTFEYLY